MHTVIETQWIPLPDGSRLAARIWMPDATPAPAILEYLPYRRRDTTAARDESVYPAFADQGFVGVRVDLRGTGDSDGLFDDEYSETELSDAEAVIAWIAEQPWSNGNVGMMGISWGGFNALQVAARKPPALKAVVSIASTVDRFADDIHFKGGALLSANLYWATQMLGRAARAPDYEIVGEGWRDIWLRRLENLPALIEPWLSHQRRDAYWKHGSISEDFQSLDAKSLVIAGWADGYRNTPWDARTGLGDNARAVTGPWVHLYPHFASPEPRFDFIGEATAWWTHWLMGKDAGVTTLPAHRLWLSEAVRPDGLRDRDPGRWIAIDHTTGQTLSLHLVPGRLQTAPAAGQAIAIRTPLDCGTAGGEYFTQGGRADLPGDQRGDDGLSVTFETSTLDAPIDIIGRPTLHIPVTIDAPTGTLAARLIDVHPDGTAHRVSLGILNLTHRNGSEDPTPMTPGKSETVTLTLDATAYRIRPGHRLRLAISTAYFPLILPPPTDITATLDTTGAILNLPTQAFDEITLHEPEASYPRYETAEPPQENREVHHDRATNRTTVTVTSDNGTPRHPGHGLEWHETRRSVWGITRDDPLSVTGEEHYTGMRRRNGVETEEIATARLTATATDWHVHTAIEARENGYEVFKKAWNFTIPRDHM